jgi:hypothetical protein
MGDQTAIKDWHLNIVILKQCIFEKSNMANCSLLEVGKRY